MDRWLDDKQESKRSTLGASNDPLQSDCRTLDFRVCHDRKSRLSPSFFSPDFVCLPGQVALVHASSPVNRCFEPRCGFYKWYTLFGDPRRETPRRNLGFGYLASGAEAGIERSFYSRRTSFDRARLQAFHDVLDPGISYGSRKLWNFSLLGRFLGVRTRSFRIGNLLSSINRSFRLICNFIDSINGLYGGGVERT